MDDLASQASLSGAPWVAYQRLGRAVGRHGLRWVQWQGDRLALGYDPQQRARRRLPRTVKVNGHGVPVAWFAAAQPCTAQVWPQVEAAPTGAAGFGTLSAVLRSRESPDTLLALTAGHVLNTGQFGDRVVVHAAADPAALLSGELYDWMPDTTPHQTVDLDAALVTLPAQALELLADDVDWPRGVRRDITGLTDLALLTRHHRIEGRLQPPLTTQVQAGKLVYTMNNALCYQLQGSSQPGDSGAPLWDLEEQLVGLHLGAAPPGALGNGFGSPIARVIDWAEAEVVTRRTRGAAANTAAPARAAEPLPKGGEHDTVARTLWGEARNQGATGMQAVAHVIFNRAADRRWRGQGGLAAICLQPAQFSCWNAADPNRQKCLDVTTADPQFQLAINTVSQVDASRRQSPPGTDPTLGATHYHAVGVLPAWALVGERTVTIGQHIFYRHVP